MNKQQSFRQHQLTRALKAAAAAGVKDPHVRIHLSDGTVLHVGGGGEVPTAPPKKSRQKGVALAEGGTDKMFEPQAAGSAKAGQMGKRQTAAPGAKGPTGGTARFTSSKAAPAKAGQVGTDSVRPVGGAARPARAGECGT